MRSDRTAPSRRISFSPFSFVVFIIIHGENRSREEAAYQGRTFIMRTIYLPRYSRSVDLRLIRDTFCGRRRKDEETRSADLRRRRQERFVEEATLSPSFRCGSIDDKKSNRMRQRGPRASQCFTTESAVLSILVRSLHVLCPPFQLFNHASLCPPYIIICVYTCCTRLCISLRLHNDCNKDIIFANGDKDVCLSFIVRFAIPRGGGEGG